MYGPLLARRTRLELQPLEARETPAGAVNAVLSGTTLVLTGDDDNNSIQLKQTPAGVEVSGLNGTAVTGGVQPFAAVTAIKAAMLDGDDSIFLDPDSALGVSGLAAFDLGGGDNVLQLSTNARLDFGGLTVLAGDGYDAATVAGGFGLGSTVKGNVSFALGIGKNSQAPPYLDTQVTVQNLEVQGLGGLKLTGLEGDEYLTLQGVNVKFALNANGGDGALVVNSTGGRFGSVAVSAVGPAHGYSTNGAWLTLTDTTVSAAVTLKSSSGANLQVTGGSLGNTAVTGAPGGDTSAQFSGNPTVTGNVTVKGGNLSVSAAAGADLTVSGDIRITGSSHAGLSAADGAIRARNVTLTGTGGGWAEYYSYDAGDGGPVPGLTTTGAMTLRGSDVQFIQQAGQLSVAGRLTAVAAHEATVHFGTGFAAAAPAARTSVGGPVLIQGRTVEYQQTESQATYVAGVTLQATEHASFESLPAALPGDPTQPDSPPYGAGATTTVGGTLTIRGRDVNFHQVEGEVTAATGITLAASEEATFETAPKDRGVAPDGSDVWGLGAKTTVTAGTLTIQGQAAGYFQAEGEASYAKGISVLGSGSATLRTEAGNVEVRNGAKLAVPAGNVLVQGGGAELGLQDGDATVAGAVTVRGTGGSQFRLDTYDSLDKGNLTVGGVLSVDGGTGEVMFGGFGNSLEVGGDVSISGAGLNRIWFDSTAGTHVGGNLKASGATGERDSFQVGTDLRVAGDTSVNLGGGANYIGFGVDGGTVHLDGTLALTTGNGSDGIDVINTTVAGPTTINTGAGADVVHLLKGTGFNGTVTVDTGGGADTFEAGLPLTGFRSIPAGTVTFNATSTVRLGSGNDTAQLGVESDPNGKVVVTAGATLTVDGGLNLDTLKAGQTAGTVNPTGFEVTP